MDPSEYPIGEEREFSHLMQLPFFNWYARELIRRELGSDAADPDRVERGELGEGGLLTVQLGNASQVVELGEGVGTGIVIQQVRGTDG